VVCRSTAFAPLAFPPVDVPSGADRQNAPEPFGFILTLTFVVPPVASIHAWFTVLFGLAVKLSLIMIDEP
jgi:hypothetical protein